MVDGITQIVGARTPLQVRVVVVRMYAVAMSDLAAWRSWADERFGDQRMHVIFTLSCRTGQHHGQVS